MTSGQKRSWEGADNEANKRLREKGDTKDWRDVHLKSEGRKQSSRAQTYERRSPGRKDNSGRRGGESGNRSRRDSDLRHPKNGQSRYPREDTRKKSLGPSRSPHRRPKSHSREGTAEEEKEEGEISPRGTPFVEPVHEVKRDQEAVFTREPSPERFEEAEMELELPPSPPPVEDILAARRARRQAILAKFIENASVTTSVSPSPGASSAAQPPTPASAISNPVNQTAGGRINPQTPAKTSNSDLTGRQNSTSVSPTPQDFALAKDENNDNPQIEQTGGLQVSAADYDPSLDRREDEERRLGVDVGDAKISENGNEIEEVSEEDEEDVDDMFAIASSEKKAKKVKKVKRRTAPALITTATLDTAADPEGYYSVILGEQLDGSNYQVFSSLGKGMFANVVRARVLQPEGGEASREVAIKIIRCQESMYRAGLKEVQILNKLKQADPEDKKHIVRLERTFEHRGHLCLVFESMSMNLRDVVKRFGKDVGLNIRAVRAYAHQLFLALSLLRKLNIMHADIKPDNILVNEQKTVLKLCDLGSASDASDNEITPYLVSRFYRAPEIILGIPYDPALDIWSIGCTLYELYTGKILFPGRSNNQMLLLMMELKGRFNTKMIKKARFGNVYFDDMGGFESVEKDRITGSDVVRKIHFSKPTRDLRARLMPSTTIADEEGKMIVAFIDLLDKCLVLDPGRRITPREALTHPFIRG